MIFPLSSIGVHERFYLVNVICLLSKTLWEWLKEWAKYFITTKNTESTKLLKGFLRVLSALRGEMARQAHTSIHSLHRSGDWESPYLALAYLSILGHNWTYND